MRLVAGLKRYFHDKRRQGLLSGKGILVLDHACDVAMDASASPLDVWSSLERCTPAPGYIRSTPSQWHMLRFYVLGATADAIMLPSSIGADARSRKWIDAFRAGRCAASGACAA